MEYLTDKYIGSEIKEYDPKGRFLIPRKFRDVPLPDMTFHAAARQRSFYSSQLYPIIALYNPRLSTVPEDSQPIRVEKNFRVCLPKDLQEILRANEQVAVWGAHSSLEVWKAEDFLEVTKPWKSVEFRKQFFRKHKQIFLDFLLVDHKE